MSSKTQNKTSCDRFNRNNVSKNVKLKRVVPKKVVLSKTLGYPDGSKSCSTGIHETSTIRRKSAKSALTFSNNINRGSIDFCKKCGDQVQSTDSSNSDKMPDVKSGDFQYIPSDKTIIGNKNGSAAKQKSIGVKQYYKNENFKYTDSLQDTEYNFKKMSLDTIKEIDTESGVNIYEVFPDSEEETGFLDTSDAENIHKIKKFREENYFECHSAKSRIDYKGNVTKLVDHKCVYRFYLNDRLFPVPLHTDHHNNVRCIECHLPIDLKNTKSINPNGTIQAKVKISNDSQDMILLLPVKDSLIIKEKRKQIKEENEVIYFGVVKLDNCGNSIFNTTLPSDSLALKYQKGYKEFANFQDYNYKGLERDDRIII
jgi:hypothetical protein